MRSRLQRLVPFLSLFLGYTVYKAAQLWPHDALTASFLAAVLFLMMLAGTFIYRANVTVFDKGWFRILAWSGSLTMAFWATFVLLSLPVDLLHALFSLAGLAFGSLNSPKYDLLWHTLMQLVFAASGALTALGFLQVLRGPQIKRATVAVPRLPQALQGLKIAQISDLHVGPTLRKGYVENVVRLINALAPDLIVLTGDIVDAHPDSVVEHLQPLAGLRAPLGCFYVTGNHEYYWGVPEHLKNLQAVGLKPLLNENSVLRKGGSHLLIAGVTDPAGAHMLEGHAPNMVKAAATSEKVDLKILLAHRPDACLEAEGLGFDLQFSGHTHAGQFFPFSMLIGLVHKYSRGLYQHGRMWVYVNPGTGYWGPADRLGVSAEISLIDLAKA